MMPLDSGICISQILLERGVCLFTHRERKMWCINNFCSPVTHDLGKVVERLLPNHSLSSFHAIYFVLSYYCSLELFPVILSKGKCFHSHVLSSARKKKQGKSKCKNATKSCKNQAVITWVQIIFELHQFMITVPWVQKSLQVSIWKQTIFVTVWKWHEKSHVLSATSVDRMTLALWVPFHMDEKLC